jgi:class 3 adenylate cyclase
MKKTVVELDLVGYSTICANLEEGLDVNSVAQLNTQIQTFVDKGLTAVDARREEHVMQTAGDSAIIVFDSASKAHRFAQAVHDATSEHNSIRKKPLAKRVFRIGAAYGDIVMRSLAYGGFDIAGTTFSVAKRFEAAAQPGGFLIDEPTFESLDEDQRKCYAAKKRISGKRDEEFEGYAFLMNADGPTDANYFTELRSTKVDQSVLGDQRTSTNQAYPSSATSSMLTREDESTLKTLPTDNSENVNRRRSFFIALAVALLLGGIIYVAWVVRTPPPRAIRTLTYSLAIQRMAKDPNSNEYKPIGDAYPSTGQEIYQHGWGFRVNITYDHSGSLYVLVERPGKGGTTTYAVLFPTPGNHNEVAEVAASQNVQTNQYFFGDQKGTDMLWIIWSERSQTELESIFKEEEENYQVISDPAQIKTVGEVLAKYESSRPAAQTDSVKMQTTLKSTAAVIVGLLALQHDKL